MDFEVEVLDEKAPLTEELPRMNNLLVPHSGLSCIWHFTESTDTRVEQYSGRGLAIAVLSRLYIFHKLKLIKSEATNLGIGTSASSCEGIFKRWLDLFPDDDNNLMQIVLEESAKVEGMHYPGGINSGLPGKKVPRTRQSKVLTGDHENVKELHGVVCRLKETIARDRRAAHTLARNKVYNDIFFVVRQMLNMIKDGETGIDAKYKLTFSHGSCSDNTEKGQAAYYLNVPVAKKSSTKEALEDFYNENRVALEDMITKFSQLSVKVTFQGHVRPPVMPGQKRTKAKKRKRRSSSGYSADSSSRASSVGTRSTPANSSLVSSLQLSERQSSGKERFPLLDLNRFRAIWPNMPLDNIYNALPPVPDTLHSHTKTVELHKVALSMLTEFTFVECDDELLACSENSLRAVQTFELGLSGVRRKAMNERDILC